MAPTSDPCRRDELLDEIIDHLVCHGADSLTTHTLSESLGGDELGRHFADEAELVGAVLARLDEREREKLRALPSRHARRGLGEIVREAWRRQLSPEDLPYTRLVHEIEGLAAGGRLPGQLPRLFSGRADLVAETFAARGVPADAARRSATLLSAAFTGLQLDYLNTGERDRTEAMLDELIALIDYWVTTLS